MIYWQKWEVLKFAVCLSVRNCMHCYNHCFQAGDVEEADVIVIDEAPSESDDSAIQPDSGRTRRACLGRMRARTLSDSGAPAGTAADRGLLERGHSFPVAATSKSHYTTSFIDSGFDKRHFVTGEWLVFSIQLMSDAQICCILTGNWNFLKLLGSKLQFCTVYICCNINI